MKHAKIALGLFAGLSALTLTGCQTLENLAKQDYNVQTIDTNLYSVEVYIPNESRVVNVREVAFNRATDYCNDKDMGAQLLDAVSSKVSAGGAKAKVIFRCVHFLKAPESSFSEE